MASTTTQRAARLAVIVAALGYFVDIYDLILFNNIRKPSLAELGVPENQQLEPFLHLLNWQMGGMLIGGIVWGVIGDKRGRLSVLFGSITLYSIANIANGFVHSLDAYAAWRFISGLGLAGELGAGVTLVSELLDKQRRGLGTTAVAALGVSGGLLAGFVGGAFESVPHPGWRTAYFIGGGLGLVLLVLRIGVVESGMFHSVLAKKDLARGHFHTLFMSKKRLLRYVAIILVGVPIWYVIAIPVATSPEIGKALGVAVNPATALFFCYGACSLGGLASGVLSQQLHSRKRALALFLGLTALSLLLYFTLGGTSETVMYGLCFLAGFASGYWAVFVQTAAELFGTNLRATVTTTVPNFVRGSVPLLTFSFRGLIGSVGIVTSAIIVGAATLVLAGIGLATLDETFGVDLDFTEE